MALVLVFGAAVLVTGIVLGLARDDVGTYVIVVAIGIGVLAIIWALSMFFVVGEGVFRYFRSR